MAVPANTIQTMTRVGNREDLSDIIYNISPTETPFVSSIQRGKANAVYHEWQTDTLADADDDNKAIQGQDLDNQSAPPTSRVGNYSQIMYKVVGTSSTQRAVRSAGRSDEHAYQMAKKGKELKRDIEKRFLSNKPAVPPTSSVAGEAAGALAWLRTNTSRGSGAGADPTLSGSTQGYPNAGATNGTQRAFTETLFKGVLQDVWTAGGDPSICLLSAKQKVVASTFSGIAQQRRETGNRRATIVGAADIYVSDFGEVRFVADRFFSDRDAFIYDPEYWSIATLDPMQRVRLAKTGLADRDAIWVEHTLRCNNEAASGVVADLS